MRAIIMQKTLIVLIISASSIASLPGAEASSSSVCNSVSCDNPQPQMVFGQTPAQNFNRPAPINVCEVLNNWKVDTVIQVVGGLLKVNWVYTLVPSLVCHLVG